MMEWNRKKMRKNAFKTVFRKGFKAWLVLIAVVFIFAFLADLSKTRSVLMTRLDRTFGLTSFTTPGHSEILEQFVNKTDLGKNLNELSPGLAEDVVNAMTSRVTILVQILEMNKAYANRNPGEMIGFIIVAMIVMALVKFFFTSTLKVGLVRFIMENRFVKVGRIRRILAPYGDRKFLHLLWVYIQYEFVMFLWTLTIVGGIYKAYSYMMVPYLLAENPSLSWREVKKISAGMTKGYKWKIFKAELSVWYLYLIGLVPFGLILFSDPVFFSLEAEFYFALRKREDIDRKAFIEPLFDGDSYVEINETPVVSETTKAQTIPGMKEESASYPDYKMKDVMLQITNFEKPDEYKVTDFIIMFFAFCLVGWIWEVGLHIVKDHAFVNRGTMYGPWIPIYGVGGVFIILFLNRYKANKVKLVIRTIILCGILEYFTSFFMDFVSNASYWDYKSMALNLNGRICMAGLTAFALGGFAGIYVVGPLIKNALMKFGVKRTKILCMVLITAFMIDLVCCFIFGPNAGEGIGEKLSRLMPLLTSGILI